jgi:hypothetical protein
MFLELLLKFKTPLLILLATPLLLGIGYYYGSKTAKPQVKTEIKEVVVEKVVEKKVFVEVKTKQEKENTHTVITKKPDGTEVAVIDTVKNTEEKTTTSEESSKESDKLTSKETRITTVGKKYKVSVLAVEKLPSLSDITKLEKPDYQIMIGRRVAGDLWIDAGYQVKQSAAVIGLSWEF